MLDRSTGGLLRDHDFRHLWAADALSQFGSRMSMLAMPLLAVLVLNASTFEVAMLRFCETFAWLALGLPVGAWVDRVRCLPLLVAADLTRAALLVSIPVAAVAGVLTLAQVYGVLLAVGVLTVVFDVGHQTYLPRLVPPADLVEGNSRLAANMSAAAVVGSGSGGFLVQLLTAPLVILIDAASYLWSALWLRGIRKREPAPVRVPDRRLRSEIGAGIRFVLGHPVLRPIGLCVATTVLFQSAGNAVTIVFLVREVGLSAGLIGLLGTAGLLGALLSSMVTTRIAARLGTSRSLLAGSALIGLGFLCFPLTGPGPMLAWFIAGTLLTSFGIILFHVLAASTRQRLCPEELLGRVSATMQFLSWGMMPAGSLLGGLVATVAGLRGTLWITGAGAATASLWLLCSPLRHRDAVPQAE